MLDTIEKVPLTRVRITYAKINNMRYIGHLDLHVVWERTLRRARMPLAYSKGYNPRPRLQIACSLPLGASSQCEMVDAWLDNPPPVEKIHPALQKAAPPGLLVKQVEEVGLNLPTLQSQMQAVDYMITLRDAPQADELARRVADLVTAPTLLRTRRDKPYDLRPLIEAIELYSGTPTRLFLTLSAREGATGRPDEVLSALGMNPIGSLIERVRLSFID